MPKSQSRFTPQHSNWYQDLPPREAPVGDGKPRLMDGDLGHMGDNCLEVSREANNFPGVPTLFAAFGLLAFVWGMFFSLRAVVYAVVDDMGFLPFSLVMLLVTVLFLYAPLLMARLDFSVAKTRPIVLLRTARRLFAYEQPHRLAAALSKWPAEVKSANWDSVGAEIVRYSGFTGKIYIQRFSLILVICKPGTNEVVDRIELKGGSISPMELEQMWDYCRLYMQNGPEGLPYSRPRPKGVSFRRSFFHYMPHLDPTEEGRYFRSIMSTGDWFMAIVFTIPLAFFLFPVGIGHYIAMRFAPDPVWPPEVLAELKAAGCDPTAHGSSASESV